jgi:hypothetical protein
LGLDQGANTLLISLVLKGGTLFGGKNNLPVGGLPAIKAHPCFTPILLIRLETGLPQVKPFRSFILKSFSVSLPSNADAD